MEAVAQRKLIKILPSLCPMCYYKCSSEKWKQFPAESDRNATVGWTLAIITDVHYCSYLHFHFHLTLIILTGGLPSAGRRLSWSPTSAGPCGVANNKISPVLVGADPGWSPSLLGLVMITIWWSSPRSILPEFSRVSKSAKRSSDVCPVIKVSDIAVCHRVVPCWTLTEPWVGGWVGQKFKWCRLPTPI